MAHVNLVSTICCRPWRSGSFPLFRGILTPIKQPNLLTPVAKTDRKVCGTVRSYYCCSGLGSEPATLRACAPDQRAAVELTYFHGFSYPEIAAIVDCPTDTVKTRMFHARRKLRNLLPAMGIAAGDLG